MKKLGIVLVLALAAGVAWKWWPSGKKGGRGGAVTLRLATTTSVKDSGLLEVLLPAFEKASGERVEVAAVGSGKALELLRTGQADVAITHAPGEEEALVAAGVARARTPFMHNDFVIVGPADGAAAIAGAGDVRDVMRAIARSGKKFVSRGDDSGTHRRELELWGKAGIAPDGEFVIRAGAGMGATLERASSEKAYTLTDRATFAAKKKSLALAIVFQGDPELINTYSVLEGAKGARGARALAEFVRSRDGRALIGGHGVKTTGEPLFTPEE